MPDKDGNFFVSLPIGTYDVEMVDMARDAVGGISGLPTMINIEEGKTIKLDIVVDTGIR